MKLAIKILLFYIGIPMVIAGTVLLIEGKGWYVNVGAVSLIICGAILIIEIFKPFNKR